MKRTKWAAVRRLGAALLVATALAVPALARAEDGLVGVPLAKKVPVVLGDDLGFGKKYRPSLGNNFQPWGVQKVARSDGFPVRLGDYAIRFETREGVCGWDGKDWSDCKNGRNRHELSGEKYDWDPWNKDRWYALSLFIPEDFHVARRMGTTLFQFWSGGSDSWSFKYWDHQGFLVKENRRNVDTVLLQPGEARGRWHDFVLRVRHSLDDEGVMQVWVDGKAALDFHGRTAKGNQKSRKPYFKFGIYNTALGEDGAPVDGRGFANGKGLPDHVVFFDEVRTGASCAALKLAELGTDCATLTE